MNNPTNSAFAFEIAALLQDLPGIQVWDGECSMRRSSSLAPDLGPGDLRVLVVVDAPAPIIPAVNQRIRGAFIVLGERLMSAGRAYACAIPPGLKPPENFQTFTILLNRTRQDVN